MASLPSPAEPRRSQRPYRAPTRAPSAQEPVNVRGSDTGRIHLVSVLPRWHLAQWTLAPIAPTDGSSAFALSLTRFGARTARMTSPRRLLAGQPHSTIARLYTPHTGSRRHAPSRALEPRHGRDSGSPRSDKCRSCDARELVLLVGPPRARRGCLRQLAHFIRGR